MSGGAAWVQALERTKKTAMVVDDVKKVGCLPMYALETVAFRCRHHVGYNPSITRRKWVGANCLTVKERKGMQCLVHLQ